MIPNLQSNTPSALRPETHEHVSGAETDDDASLMSRIAAGDQAAFSQLVRRHTDRFYRVAYRFTAHRQDAEDRVQEAFVKLWERPQMWEAGRNSAFTTWFHRVVINLCLDHQKKKRPILMEDDTWIRDERDSHEEVLMNRQREQLLDQAIAHLPERQRVALNLCFYEELSNQEAADIMGVGLKALQSLLMRAKQTLKDYLKEKGGAYAQG
jgi:RNA polymerase sigma-70 factor, ECF subfamily